MGRRRVGPDGGGALDGRGGCGISSPAEFMKLKKWRRAMSKSAIIVATVVSSLGLVCYQSYAVRQVEPRTVHVGEVVQPAEVKALAAEIESKLAKLENVPALAELDPAVMPA